MATPKETFYENQAATIIKKLNMRKMEGYYCKNVEEAKAKMLELIGNEKKTVGYGGSMTLDENGFKDSVTAAGHELIIRENYKTPEEEKELKSKLTNADFFLMSTNAITLDGELVNIDGRGNRVSYLIYGPDNVIVIAGMNKVVSTVEDGYRRIRNIATPPNCNRLDCKTPCATTGKCGECFTDSICCEFVTTRMSRVPNRIKVILVGETLGY
ncbi:MAG: lactate utilization protein [Treponema sp.]|nr:lactate utilization protein [uncultured Treponema sp.]MCI5696619.1 lactate utilization protein [Spirochaetia bacterium]MDY5885356.1 lactate utilization protein [Treponema sp.]